MTSTLESAVSKKTDKDDMSRQFEEQSTQHMSVGMSVQAKPDLGVAGTPGTPHTQPKYKFYYEIESADRSAFRGIEFLLSVVGLAVGLGNIWRFPMVVYENGGSSFLIPYMIVIFLFAIPLIHMEFALGQYAAKSPPAVFRRIMPALEGLGWMSCIVVSIIAIYYMILLSWISVYLFNTTNVAKISRCGNEWNNATNCYDITLQKKCNGNTQFGPNVKLVYINGKCQNLANVTDIEAGTEQFFIKSVVGPSKGLLDINSLNWQAFTGLLVCWIITAAILIRGMKSISKMSYVTAIFPYFIIIVLLVRSATLDGAAEGLDFFLWKADFNALLRYRTWSAALTQACFSISLGTGGMMNTASYNKRTYNWYRDAFLVVFFDTLMSVLGGIAVFSTLGFLAKQRGVTVPEVVKSGPQLAFVVYTEAISHMPVAWLWYGLFFVMLFLLGLGTEIIFVETVCSCLIDRFRPLRKHRWAVVLAVCSSFFVCGIIMTTDAGYYWFEMFDEYASGVTASILATMTCVVVIGCYGLRNFRDDINEMWGDPQNAIEKFLGPSSAPWTFFWTVSAPLCSLVCLAFFFFSREYPFKGDAVRYPLAFDIMGWTISTCSLIIVPICATLAVLRFKRMKIPISGVFMLQRQHPSYERISRTWPEEKRVIGDQLPEREPGDQDIEMVDANGGEKDEESIIE